MEFSALTLSQAFYQIRQSEKGRRFPLFAFVLGTEADGEIFPDLMKYYGELHELTGPHMLIIAPTINVGDDLTTEQTARKLRQVAEDISFQRAKEKFLERQRKESYRFAQMCEIPTDKLPCIVFFASLEDTREFLLWEIKDATAEAIVADFRKITDKIRGARKAGKSDLLQEIGTLRTSLALNCLRRVVATHTLEILALLLELAKTLN